MVAHTTLLESSCRGSYVTNTINVCRAINDNRVMWCSTTGAVLIDFSLTVKAATLIFISGRSSAISFTKEGESGFIYNKS